MQHSNGLRSPEDMEELGRFIHSLPGCQGDFH